MNLGAFSNWSHNDRLQWQVNVMDFFRQRCFALRCATLWVEMNSGSTAITVSSTHADGGAGAELGGEQAVRSFVAGLLVVMRGNMEKRLHHRIQR